MTGKQTTPPTAAGRDAFDAAWRAATDQARPGLRLWAAVGRLTGWAERPASIEQLTAELRLTAPDTLALIRQWGSSLRVDGGRVYHDHPAAPAPRTRWRIHVGDRTLYSESGCAVDLFAMVLWSGKAATVDTHCPDTATPIRAHLSPEREGTAWAEPATAVVSVTNPTEITQLDQRPVGELDKQICTHQVFFASPQAAARWQAANPGGRLIPVDQVFAWMYRVGLH